MKIKTLLCCLSIFLLSCGSRNKEVAKSQNTEQFTANLNVSQKESGQKTSEASVDLSRFFQEYGLKIQSTGSDYSLNFGGLVFQGNANLEITDKKENSTTKTFTKTFEKWMTETVYKSHTTYRTITVYRTLHTTRQGVSFGDILLIIGVSVVIWELLKYAVKSRIKL